jgi:hypothetical protein
LIPLWLKIAYTLFLCVLVPIYWRKADAGPRNFLWFSDLALFAIAGALWLENSLLASTAAVGVLIPESFWNISFLIRLVTGKQITDLTAYMFESQRPLYMRALSLFHVMMPPMLLWLLARLGYDERGLLAMTVASTVVLPLTYAVTERHHNINWVHGWSGRLPWGLSPRVYLLLLMLAFPIVIFVPTHLLLRTVF